MELIFLYIADFYSHYELANESRKGSSYKSIKNCGFNFSNDYKFSVRKSRNKYLIDIKKVEAINNFYDPSGKILNITGIVGKNGTGKSSLLDFIIGLSQNRNDLRQINYGFIAVYRTNKNDHDKKNRIVYQWHMAVEFEKNCQFIDEFKLSRIDFDNDFDNYIPNNRIVKYSNIFEANTHIEIPPSGKDDSIIDISTTTLIKAAPATTHNVNNQNQDVLLEFRNSEIKRQAKLIVDQRDRSFFEFKMPEYLKITIDSYDVDYVLENEDVSKEHMVLLNKINDRLQIEVKKAQKIDSAKRKFIILLHRAAFFSFIKINLPQDSFFKIETSLLKDINSSNNIIDSIRRFIKKVRIEQNDLDLPLLEFFNRIEKFDESLFKSYPLPNVCVKIDKEILSLIDLYFNAELFSDIVSFDWMFSPKSSGELSSGEKSYFSLFARFYEASQNHRLLIYSDQHVIVLIDEGDQYLHPEWQRKFVFWITNFIPVVFTTVNSVQIIITSHSPFIVSDLRKEDVIFLEKDKNGKTNISSLEKHNETFGANIHSLYSDSFFMKDGLIGEFSKQKIKDLISFLDTKRQISRKFEFDKNSSHALIKLIGEQVLKKHLQNMWEKKYKPELHSTSKEELFERIAKLELENKILKDETNRNS